MSTHSRRRRAASHRGPSARENVSRVAGAGSAVIRPEARPAASRLEGWPGVTLRSAQWYAGDSRNAYIHRAWMRRGIPGDAFDRPQIAIANTASDLTPCNAHLTEVAASVRNGVLEADRKSTRLNSSHANISYAVFCLKKKKKY